MSGASSCPSSRGGGPIRRRMHSRREPAGPRDDAVLDRGGSRGSATRAGYAPAGDESHTGTSPRDPSLAGRDDGGSDDNRSAAGQPGARATAAAQPAAAAPDPDRDLVAPGAAPALRLPGPLRRHVHAPHRLRRHLGDARRSRPRSSRSSPAIPRSSTPARATRSSPRSSAATRSSSSTRSRT